MIRINGIPLTPEQHEAYTKYFPNNSVAGGPYGTLSVLGHPERITIDVDGLIHKRVAGKLHCMTGPALIYGDGTHTFYLDGRNVPRHLYELITQIPQYCSIFNAGCFINPHTLQPFEPLFSIAQVETLSRTWIWKHSDRDKILQNLLSKAIAEHLDSTEILKAIEYRWPVELLPGKPLKELAQETIKPLLTQKQIDAFPVAFGNHWVPPGMSIDPRGTLSFSITDNRVIQISIDGEISRYIKYDGRLLLNSEYTDTPAHIDIKGNEHYYIYGNKLSDGDRLIYQKWGIHALALLGAPPRAYSHIYQIQSDDLPKLEKYSVNQLNMASTISRECFRNTDKTVDILTSVSTDELEYLFFLEKKSPPSVYDTLMSLLKAKEESGILDTAANFIGTAIAKVLLNQEESVHVTA